MNRQLIKGYLALELRLLTKREVDNQILIPEVRREAARVVHEVGVGSSPISRVDGASSVLNVAGDTGIVSSPEPQIDLVCSPFGGIPIREFIPSAW